MRYGLINHKSNHKRASADTGTTAGTPLAGWILGRRNAMAFRIAGENDRGNVTLLGEDKGERARARGIEEDNGDARRHGPEALLPARAGFL